MRLRFALSLLAIGLFYWRVVAADQLGTVVLLGIGAFTFFSAITRSLIAIERSERQLAVWEAMSPEQRLDLVTTQGQLERDFTRLIDQGKKDSAKLREATAKLRADMKRLDRDRARSRRKAQVERIHRWTIRIRKRLAGDRLLTARERLDEWILEKNANEFLSNLDRQRDATNLAAIRAGIVPPTPVEGTPLVLFHTDGRAYFEPEGPVDVEGVESFARSLEELDIKPTSVVYVLPAAQPLSLQAERRLEETGIRVFREGKDDGAGAGATDQPAGRDPDEPPAPRGERP